ncbi:LysR substrate-binding domain-containing protein [Ruegeria arenilitoris]|uniref:LysR substrate-binding domain-containing protein n=1 Tax=Ruegeria arenilitoris TaxID=1173585 RepID=UPI00147C6B28|nr:LysR substrate-binding domain-containing protein [Ruegeria arenilitoris]
MPALVTVNDADTVHHLIQEGFGIGQAPKYRFLDDLEDGRLVEVLPDTPPSPTPLAAFYPQNRQLSPRVRVFLDWVIRIFDKVAL